MSTVILVIFGLFLFASFVRVFLLYEDGKIDYTTRKPILWLMILLLVGSFVSILVGSLILL